MFKKILIYFFVAYLLELVNSLKRVPPPFEEPLNGQFAHYSWPETPKEIPIVCEDKSLGVELKIHSNPSQKQDSVNYEETIINYYKISVGKYFTTRFVKKGELFAVILI
jgi:hypothetical protein